MGDNGKISSGVEVEPPEDMHATDYKIDPSMMMWKSMAESGGGKQALEPEEDLDDLHHPSTADLFKRQVKKLGALPVDDSQEDPLKDFNMKYYQEPEEDKDDLAHPVGEDYYEAMEKVREYLSPLVAKYDDGIMYDGEVYYQDSQYPPVQKEPLGREIMGAREVGVHFEPEEDMDDLFHKDAPQFVPYQMHDKAAAPADGPFQEYNEPEEDLDSLYHKWPIGTSQHVQILIVSKLTALKRVSMINTI